MTAEQIAQLKAKLLERGKEYKEGYASGLAAVSRRMLEDARAASEIPGSSQVFEYLQTMALELADDAEALRG